jgi:hypothetical protein
MDLKYVAAQCDRKACPHRSTGTGPQKMTVASGVRLLRACHGRTHLRRTARGDSRVKGDAKGEGLCVKQRRQSALLAKGQFAQQ